jgi:hypothetical protein
MIINNVNLQLSRIQKYQGVSKDGREYAFYEGKFLDEDGLIYALKIDKYLFENEQNGLKLMSMKNVPVELEIDLRPAGFKLNGTVLALTK